MYIDEALNVVYPVGNVEEGPLVVFMAHTDVVFPDMEELPMREEDGKLYCPGIGDDTIHVDETELTLAEWHHRDAIPEKDDGMTITREMIRVFAEGKEPK